MEETAMKKAIALALIAASLLMLIAGCRKQETVVFTAVIEEVYENGGILVNTSDDVGFDKASVSFTDDAEEPDFTFAPGQTVKLTILPEIAESYPVQVRAVKIELLIDAGAPIPID
jgi:hypothetical protein